MNFLDRNVLPKFQERLDLAASELNDMEDIYCEAINELAGRIYVLNHMIPAEERSKYTEETSFVLLDTMDNLMERMNTLESTMSQLQEEVTTELSGMNDKYLELEARLNALDDAAARKQDLNTILYRTGRPE